MAPQHSARRDSSFVISAAVLWGTVGVATRAIATHSETNALSIAFLRLFFATIIFLMVSCTSSEQRRRLLKIKRDDLVLILLMGIMQAVYQASYNAAIDAVGVTISTLIALCAAPVIVALFAACSAREHPTLVTTIALACALSGTVLLVATRSHPSTGQIALPGVLLALLAACGYGGYIICGQRLTGRYHPLQVNTLAFGTGALLLLGSTTVTGLGIHYPVWGWLLLLYLGAVPTALAYGLFQIGMRSLSATVTSILTLCEPLIAALLAWIFFHEELGLSGLIGVILLLGAMLLLVKDVEQQ